MEGKLLKLKIESTEPIHWVITATWAEPDLRNFIKLLLKPSILYYAISLMLKKKDSANTGVTPHEMMKKH